MRLEYFYLALIITLKTCDTTERLFYARNRINIATLQMLFRSYRQVSVFRAADVLALTQTRCLKN